MQNYGVAPPYLPRHTNSDINNCKIIFSKKVTDTRFQFRSRFTEVQVSNKKIERCSWFCGCTKNLLKLVYFPVYLTISQIISVHSTSAHCNITSGFSIKSLCCSSLVLLSVISQPPNSLSYLPPSVSWLQELLFVWSFPSFVFQVLL